MSFRYDLHLHSRASVDCRTSYRALSLMARRRGLSGIALTDHDTIAGAEQARETWPSDLQLIIGCERTLFDKCHVIGLFLSRNLTSDTIRDLIPEIHEQGGLVYLPHPFRAYSGLFGAGSKLSPEDQAWALSEADIIEIFNRKCTAEENRLACNLLADHSISFAAGSDAHEAYEIGMACTEFDVPLSPQSFQSSAAYAPPSDVAAKLSSFRNGQISPARAMTRDALKSLRLLDPARRARNYLFRYRTPILQKYR